MNVSQPIEATINLGSAKVKGETISVLTNSDTHAHNTFEKPNEVVTVTSPLSVSGRSFKHIFPPASVNVIELDME